jgi:acetyl esterase/lipase
MTIEIKDIEYARDAGKALALDLYLPKDKPGVPLVVWVPGGAWQFAAKRNVHTALVEHGFALASIDFRQAPAANVLAQVHEIKAAVRYLRANAGRYGYRGDRIAIWGMSSGGHLAALVGTTNGNRELEGSIGDYPNVDSSVQAVVDFFGPTNLLTILPLSTPHGLSVRVPALKALLGKPVEDPSVQALARLASPVYQVDKGDPPLLIMHGVQDNQVPVNQSLELQGAYRALGLDVELHLVPGVGHMDQIYYTPAYTEILARFLSRVLQ